MLYQKINFACTYRGSTSRNWENKFKLKTSEKVRQVYFGSVIFVQCTHPLRLANTHVWCDFGIEIFRACILSTYPAPAKVSGQYLFYKDKEKDKEIGS